LEIHRSPHSLNPIPTQANPSHAIAMFIDILKALKILLLKAFENICIHFEKIENTSTQRLRQWLKQPSGRARSHGSFETLEDLG
jgi:hypothetical protein